MLTLRLYYPTSKASHAAFTILVQLIDFNNGRVLWIVYTFCLLSKLLLNSDKKKLDTYIANMSLNLKKDFTTANLAKYFVFWTKRLKHLVHILLSGSESNLTNFDFYTSCTKRTKETYQHYSLVLLYTTSYTITLLYLIYE